MVHRVARRASPATVLVPEATTLAPQIERAADKLALMPGSIRKPRREVDDDF